MIPLCSRLLAGDLRFGWKVKSCHCGEGKSEQSYAGLYKNDHSSSAIRHMESERSAIAKARVPFGSAQSCFITIQQVLVAIDSLQLLLDYDTCHLSLARTISKDDGRSHNFKMTKKAPERPTGVGFCTHNRGGGRRCGRETDYKPDGMSRFSVSSPLPKLHRIVC